MAQKGVLLLSGGFDSPVAGYLMARQGLDLLAAHFPLEPITDRAKAIGTYEVSKGPEICDLLGPPKPATHARLDQILAEEAKIDSERLIASCLAGVAAEKLKGDGSAVPVPSSPRSAR